MMSNDRIMIRAAEYASMVLAILNLAAAAWAAMPGSEADNLKTPLLLSFGFFFFIALLVAAQFTRLARQLDPTQPTGDDLDGLRFQELKRLLKWAPKMPFAKGMGDVIAWAREEAAAGKK